MGWRHDRCHHAVAHSAKSTQPLGTGLEMLAADEQTSEARCTRIGMVRSQQKPALAGIMQPRCTLRRDRALSSSERLTSFADRRILARR